MVPTASTLNIIHILDTMQYVNYVYLSAAQPTDQGTERVVVLLLVVVGKHFTSTEVQFFGV